MLESAACRDSGVQEVTHVGVSARARSRDDWQRAHEELRRLARSRAGLDFEEGQWLLAAWRGGVHARLGYGSFREYVERHGASYLDLTQNEWETLDYYGRGDHTAPRRRRDFTRRFVREYPELFAVEP